jgi:hypothetical protein
MQRHQKMCARKLLRQSDIRERIHFVAIGIGFAFDTPIIRGSTTLANEAASQAVVTAVESVRDQFWVTMCVARRSVAKRRAANNLVADPECLPPCQSACQLASHHGFAFPGHDHHTSKATQRRSRAR